MSKPATIHPDSTTPEHQANDWAIATLLTIAAVAALLLLFYQTTLSTVAIWNRSETFAHGFLIFPISAFLIWGRRKEIALLSPQPDLRGLPVLLLFGFGWLLAYLARVLVVQQYALVAMIPVLVWIILGLRVTRALTFPLGFLFFAVPMGEFLIPYMMEFTADFTVTALQLTGIPVYREGLFFTIPSGQWSVVEGCSGLRYLIASLTLGCLYAYLTYRSTRRRIIFTILSVIVPVIANGLRAYMIVMIAHLSDMKLALGVDHYIYGWAFFGLVMLLLFWIGAFWREDLPQAKDDKPAATPTNAAPLPLRRIALVTLAAVSIAAMWPGYAAYLKSHVPLPVPIKLEVPAANGWIADPSPLSDWQPDYSGSDASLTQTYRKGSKAVSLYIGYYLHQHEGAQLVTSTNVIVRQKHPVWSNVGETSRVVTIDSQPLPIVQTKLRSATLRLLVWNWNRIGDTSTVNAYFAKMMEAKARLLGQHDDAAAIILSSPYDGDMESAAVVMQEFIGDMLPTIETSLKQAANGS
ncbi:MAG: exosortase A [Gammaproteobacteria bacterium]|nr:exosortase A [Gammaproteobacteria bacterium]MBU1979289.1 exosortase A [Gammaproteobacteria bacterium]